MNQNPRPWYYDTLIANDDKWGAPQQVCPRHTTDGDVGGQFFNFDWSEIRVHSSQ